MTARRRRLERRGRPRKANAKRRQTTTAGRRAPDDHGSPELAARKRRVANGSAEPVELRDVSGILCAHHLIEAEELATLRLLAQWLRALALAHHIGQAPPGGLWSALTSGAGFTGWFVPPAGSARGADRAAFRLAELFQHFAELRALDQLALVLRVALAEGYPADQEALAELRAGVRIIMELQRRGRRRPIRRGGPAPRSRGSDPELTPPVNFQRRFEKPPIRALGEMC
jgi:hypothetical protein